MTGGMSGALAGSAPGRLIEFVQRPVHFEKVPVPGVGEGRQQFPAFGHIDINVLAIEVGQDRALMTNELFAARRTQARLHENIHQKKLVHEPTCS